MRTKLLALVAAALVLVPATSASADLPGLPDLPEKSMVRPHWAHKQVCVENHAPRAWDTAEAVRRWNSVRGKASNFVLRGSCDGKKQRVIVRIENSRGDHSGVSIEYTNADSSLRLIQVRLNPSYFSRSNFPASTWSCARSYTTTHELGHALGLRHYPNSHSGAVMSYQGWQRRCGGLAPSDREDLRKLYAS